MNLPVEVHDWAPYYQLLFEHGYTDGEISDLAGVSRFVVNRVRLGRYRHSTHTLSYNGGMNIVIAAQEYIPAGWGQ